MEFLRKIKKVIDKEIMAFVTKESPEDNVKNIEYHEMVPDVVFKGVWDEEEQAKWNYFTKKEKPEIEDAGEIILEGTETTILEEGETLEEYEKDKISAILKQTAPKKDMEKAKITVFFVDDDTGFQITLKNLLAEIEEIEITGWADDGMDAIEKLKNMATMPDVILMDIEMPRMNGIKAVKKIFEINPLQKIIMLSVVEKKYVIAAFAAGVMGYLRKDAGLPLIRDAIIQVAGGESAPIQDEIASYLLEGTEEFEYFNEE